MKPKNEPIGECPCPRRGCDKVAKVFKFRGRENEKQRRLAGKLYLQCPEDGRFGADAAPAMQDYILENSTIWERKNAPSAAPADDSPKPPAEPVNPPEKLAEIPTNPPPQPPAKSRDVWNL